MAFKDGIRTFVENRANEIRNGQINGKEPIKRRSIFFMEHIASGLNQKGMNAIEDAKVMRLLRGMKRDDQAIVVAKLLERGAINDVIAIKLQKSGMITNNAARQKLENFISTLEGIRESE